MELPRTKPNNPNFSSGPCSKRPNWSIENLKNALVGRSHRASECKNKLKEVIDKSKSILGLPSDYLVGIMPASDTGALESAMWCLLGSRGIDILAWENFGNDWVLDVVDELKIHDKNIHLAPYGELPDLNKINFSRDVIFTWNGTTSGVKIPNGNWIPDDREGLTICDATSAVFAMEVDYKKCDVLTWSWQKVLGGEAAHGMVALSPKAVKRLQNHKPSWPVPKVFRMASNKKLISGIFEGNTINTPSMLCVEDAIDSLNWVNEIGGLESLIQKSNKSLKYIEEWVDKTNWVEFLSKDPKTRSNTSITFKIKENWFKEKEEKLQRDIMKEITNLLIKESVAYDINGYPKAPASFRIWGGGTVEPDDINKLLPWIDWAYNKVRSSYA
jgi:phosphoserine aminotransferase|tara:strand:+ start:7 stop:1164 length:1158 start_codon:yes stop_codon:yes gene_type:complete